MYFLLIVALYVFFNAVTTFVISPLQSVLLPEVTIFASLVYLPHGVRVLATWAYGWKAIPPLFVGGSISSWVFRSSSDLAFLEPGLIGGLVVGAVAAFLAFELARLFGFNLYFGSERKLKWRGMIVIGAVSSLLNSAGQTLAYSGLIQFAHFTLVPIVFVIGDLIGLITCMVALMFVFRWTRETAATESDG